MSVGIAERRWLPTAALVPAVALLAVVLVRAKWSPELGPWQAVAYFAAVLNTPLTVGAVIVLLATWGEQRWARHLSLAAGSAATAWNAELVRQVGFDHRTALPLPLVLNAGWIEVAAVLVMLAALLRVAIWFPSRKGALALTRAFLGHRPHRRALLRLRATRDAARAAMCLLRPGRSTALAALTAGLLIGMADNADVIGRYAVLGALEVALILPMILSAPIVVFMFSAPLRAYRPAPAELPLMRAGRWSARIFTYAAVTVIVSWVATAGRAEGIGFLAGAFSLTIVAGSLAMACAMPAVLASRSDRAPVGARRALGAYAAATLAAVIAGVCYVSGYVGDVGAWSNPPVPANARSNRLHLMTQRPIPRDSLISADGRLLAGRIDDNTVGVWDNVSGLLVRRFDAGDAVEVLRWHPDGEILAVLTWSKVHLFDVSQNRTVRIFSPATPQKTASALAFSPDGSTLYTGHYSGELFAWSLDGSQRRRVVRGDFRLASRDGAIRRIEVAETGRVLALRGDGVGVIDTAGPRRWHSLPSDDARTARLSRSGRFLLVWSRSSAARSDPRTVQLMDAETGAVRAAFPCRTGRFRGDSVALESCRTGSRVLWAEGRTTVMDSTPSPAEARERHDGVVIPGALKISGEGRFLAVRVGQSVVHVWDLERGQEIRRVDAAPAKIADVAFAGGMLYTVDSNVVVRAWSLRGGADSLVVEMKGPPSKRAPTNPRFEQSSPLAVRYTTAELLWTRPLNGPPRLLQQLPDAWDWRLQYSALPRPTFVTWGGEALRRYVLATDSGRVLATIPRRVLSFDVTEDLRTAATIGTVAQSWIGWTQTRAFAHDLATGSARALTLVDDAAVTASPFRTVFAPSGELLVMYLEGTIRAWSADGARIRGEWRPHSWLALHSAFSPDGTMLFTSSRDGSVAVSSLADRRVLVRLLSFRDGTWATVDDAGRFDASNGGDVDGLHWTVGMEPIQLTQLRERYYDPGLLAKHLGVHSESLREVEAFDRVALFPEMKIDVPRDDSLHLTVSLRNRGGGIGRVTVHVNGRESVVDARPVSARRGDSVRFDIDVKQLPFVLPGRDNAIEVRAFDRAGHLSTRPVSIAVRAPSAARGFEVVQQDAAGAAPRLWALVVGISNYDGTRLDLRFAARDAVTFGNSLDLAARRLFGDRNVQVTVLSTDPQSGPTWPTKSRIRASLEQIAERARPEDVVVVYLAGHGTVHGGAEGEYYYLAADARSGDLTDPVVRGRVALSATELGDLMRIIPGMKQVLILDTCGSGRASAGLAVERDVPSSQVRSVQRMKDRVGMFVLAGSAADAVAYEASRYGQGVLTYSLLLGMRGAALRDDEFVDVSQLFSFAVDRVPQLAAAIGGIQRPEIAVPRSGASFDLGRLSRDDRARIRISAPASVVLRSNYQDEIQLIDHLGVGALVDERFREVSALPGSRIIFADARQMPDAFRLAGRYRVAGGSVIVETRVFAGRRPIAVLSDTGAVDDLDGVTRQVARRVMRVLRPEPAGATP